jgi:hypothetical protein
MHGLFMGLDGTAGSLNALSSTVLPCVTGARSLYVVDAGAEVLQAALPGTAVYKAYNTVPMELMSHPREYLYQGTSFLPSMKCIIMSHPLSYCIKRYQFFCHVLQYEKCTITAAQRKARGACEPSTWVIHDQLRL